MVAACASAEASTTRRHQSKAGGNAADNFRAHYFLFAHEKLFHFFVLTQRNEPNPPAGGKAAELLFLSFP
jgi:hypothetical protein